MSMKFIQMSLYRLIAIILVGTTLFSIGILYTQNLGKDSEEIPRVLGILGDLSKFNLTITCPLPDVPKNASKIRLERPAVNIEQARGIASNIFGFERIDSIKTEQGPTKMTVVRSLPKVIEFNSLVDIFYHESTETIVQKWNEYELKEIADNTLNKLDIYWPSDSTLTREFLKVTPFCISEYSNGTTIVESVAVMYSTSFNDIEFYGPGADFYIAIAEGRVVLAELHMPKVHIEDTINITVSPEQAINNLVQGKGVSTTLGVGILPGPIPEQGELIIEKIDLVYYVNHLLESVKEHPPLLYRIQGKIVDSTICPFVEYEYATS